MKPKRSAKKALLSITDRRGKINKKEQKKKKRGEKKIFWNVGKRRSRDFGIKGEIPFQLKRKNKKRLEGFHTGPSGGASPFLKRREENH